jgi:type II secretory pathway component PulJ
LAESGAVQIPPKALITASQLRSQTKNQILDQMSGANDPMAQQMAQMQQRMLEMEAMLKEAQVRRENAAAAKDEAATVESQIDAAVKVAEFTSPDAQPAQKTAVNVN